MHIAPNKDVAQMGRKIANRRARAEILPQVAYLTKPENLKVLRRSWEPFKRVLDQKYGYVLNAGDPMVLDIMRTRELYDMLEQIGVEAMQEAMADSSETKTFVQDLLDQLKAAAA